MKQSEFTRLLTKARKDKGLTQEDVCLSIGIAEPSTLSRWETGKEIPSERMMAKVVQAYEEPLLGYIYLQSCTELGRMILPPIIHAGLDNLALRFQKEYNDVQYVQMDMVEIACDGIVETDELERWNVTRKELVDVAKVWLPLIIGNLEQEKSSYKVAT